MQASKAEKQAKKKKKNVDNCSPMEDCVGPLDYQIFSVRS